VAYFSHALFKLANQFRQGGLPSKSLHLLNAGLSDVLVCVCSGEQHKQEGQHANEGAGPQEKPKKNGESGQEHCYPPPDVANKVRLQRCGSDSLGKLRILLIEIALDVLKYLVLSV